MRSALVSPLSDRICIEMCSLTIDDVDSGRLNDRYRATCGKTMGSENNGTASRSVYEALNPTYELEVVFQSIFDWMHVSTAQIGTIYANEYIDIHHK